MVWTCECTHTVLTDKEQHAYTESLHAIGIGTKPRVLGTDTHGNKVYGESPFAAQLKSRLQRERRIVFKQHARLAFSTVNTPRVDDFEAVVGYAHNIRLGKLVGRAEACYSDPRYRAKFMKNPSTDGIESNMDQAVRFFVEEYAQLQSTTQAILDAFATAQTEDEFVAVVDRMLDLRYGKNNRRPTNAPWMVSPRATIHRDDIHMFRGGGCDRDGIHMVQEGGREEQEEEDDW